MNRATASAATGARPRYSIAEKVEIIKFAQAHSVQAASTRFHVARSSIYLWWGKEAELNRSLEELQSTPEETNTSSSQVHTTDGVVAICAPPDAPGLRREHADETQLHESPQTGGETTTRRTTAAYQPAAINDSGSGTQETQHEPSVARRDHHLRSVGTNRHDNASDFVIIGHQGAEGGFANISARRLFSELVSRQALPTPAFKLTGDPHPSHILDALHKNRIQCGFIATDVLLSNTHHANLDRIVASRLRMVGEVVCPEEVGVCALPGTELCDADCVISDWPTLQRYEDFIRYLEMQYNKRIYRQSAWDSAAACKVVQEEMAGNTLVLCNPSTALARGLVILQSRALGSPSVTQYTVLGRVGTTPLAFEDIHSRQPASAKTRLSTLLVNGAGRAILDVISAFAYRGLEIVAFHIRIEDDGEEMRSYVISYRASTNPSVERGLHIHLAAAAERVIALGDYATHTL